MILAIDPGPVRSAVVQWDGQRISYKAILPNEQVRDGLYGVFPRLDDCSDCVAEMVHSFGMPVGKEVFETVVWIGRFWEAWGEGFHRIGRIDVKMHLCHSARAKDSNIRQALIDRFGLPGTKHEPGLTYGISNDLWSAFAVAVTWWDRDLMTKEQR